MNAAVANLYSGKKLCFISGPCVIESYDLCATVAEHLKNQTQKYGVDLIFKASFDKANRTSIRSFRGPGMEEGLKTLAKIKRDLGLAVLTDIHTPEQAAPVAEVVDVLQIPAFLCRQTDIIVAAAKTGKPTNIKKGQFLAPEDMKHVVQKFRQAGGKDVSVTERGASFGYHNLVVDMRSLVILRQVTQAPVVFDATHSVQKPSAGDGVTAGDRHFAPLLARAAAAVGVQGLFCEVHPRPDDALSDGPNSLDFELFEQLVRQTTAIDAVIRQHGI